MYFQNDWHNQELFSFMTQPLETPMVDFFQSICFFLLPLSYKTLEFSEEHFISLYHLQIAAVIAIIE